MRKILIFVLLITACSSEINTSGFDKEAWKNDKNSCNSIRKNQLDIFEEKIKSQLLFRSESILRDVLGKPDRTEPSQRGQKFYFYFLEKGKQCDDNLPEADFLQIRIDAIGRVNEITTIHK